MSIFRPLRKLVVVLSILLLAGCATKHATRIDGRQFAPVDDPEGPKTIALVLASYSSCEENDQDCKDRLSQLNELQAKFEFCIEQGLHRTSPQVALIKKIRSGQLLKP
jgi:uncharacterized lipoprotein YajG